MNKIILVLVAAMTLFSTTSNAQELSKKERKALAKEVSAQAKKMEKEGWVVTPGSKSLSMQYSAALQKLNMEDEDGYPKYITGEAMSIGGNYDAAKLQAISLAKLTLSQTVESELTAIIDNQLSNQQLEEDEAASIAKTVSASKELVSQKLGRVITLVECYRTKANKNKEVYVRIAYDTKKAMELAKQVVKEKLQDENDELSARLNEKLGW